MGTKLFFTGIAIALLLPPVINIPAASVVGAVLGFIGIVLIWLDK
ncbi:MAG: hypothetical protein UY48_C0029G0011 [Candidatus Gottesmanbacteria bacterium GW2011_GWB1_49_7]|uniref:Uncharacterized protein n=1 Tax=Candidatus Gottesmanbacteria bacterium GW2011_GWB1_49_7 TaxID=1618448 RepID=A0A0G1YWS8_9BACT|nr:MAG: hypothetical protein UY48_C0029G0011 [Candidatus Gottesmanbacteria bacterium GW2011_GWB1_49_7]